METKNKTKFGVIVCIIVAIWTVVAFGIKNADLKVFADEVNMNSSADYLDSDYLNDELTNKIQDYKDRLIGINAAVIKDENGYNINNPNKDDYIVEIIPKRYFYTPGTTLEIGKEYGFFIETEGGGDKYSSTAIVFDIDVETRDPVMVDTAIVSVTPLFEYQYICVKGNGIVNIDGNSISYSTNAYCVFPYATIDGSSISYQQVNKFYLKDISFSSVLYNEQALNVGDPGYSAENDYGAFFTGFDYAYNGKVREYGEFPDDAMQNITSDCVEIALGFVDTVVSGIPILGNIVSGLEWGLTISSTISDSIELYNGVKSYTDGELEQTNKKITATSLYKNREDQLAHYRDNDGNPQFSKIASVTCNTGTEQSLWYGIGDYAKGYFYIGHGAQTGMSSYYTRIVSDIALKIVSSDTDKVIAIKKGATSGTIRDAEYKNSEMEKMGDVYMLPEGEDHFMFSNVKFESDYIVDIHLTDNASVSMNGEEYYGKDFTITQKVKIGKGINIDFSENTIGLKGTIKISPATNMNGIVVSSSGEYILKVDLQGMKQLQTNNADVKIEGIYTYTNGSLQKYEPFGILQETSSISYPLKQNTYYIILHNNNTFTSTVSLTISDVKELLLGENTTTLQAENFNYFKLTAKESKNYVLSFDGIQGNNFSYQLLNESMQLLHGNSYLKGVYIFSMSKGNNYYIGFRTGAYEDSATVLIGETNNSFTWKIFDGEFGKTGALIEDRRIEVTRGYTYKLEFLINGIEKETAFIFEDTQTSFGLYGVTYDTDAGTFTIPDNSPIGGNGIFVKAWASVGEDTSYNSTLSIVPKLEEVSFSEIINNDDLGFKILVPKYVIEIGYTLSLDGKTSSEYLIENKSYTNSSTMLTESILTKINLFDYVAPGFVTIKITKIYYIDALKNEDAISYSKEASVHNLFENGYGTSLSPYLISCSRHFYNMEYNRNNEVYFKINAYLNITKNGLNNFYGILDGAGIPHVSWTANVTNVGGLILHNYGTIKNLQVWSKVEFVGAETSGYDIGGIVSYNEYGGRIENCSANFESTSLAFTGVAGGIVAVNKGVITDSWVSVQVTTDGIFGGIAGDNKGAIKNCQITGSIRQKVREYEGWYENSVVGGIAAINRADIINCCIGSDRDSFLRITIDVNYTNDKYLAPYTGPVYGQKEGGMSSGCYVIGYSLNTGNLHTAQNHDQKENINEVYNY